MVFDRSSTERSPNADLASPRQTLPRTRFTTVQWAGLVLGPLLALGAYAWLPGSPDSALFLTQAGRATAAIGVWMAVWWLTEAVEIPVTALLPVTLFPLVGAASVSEAASPYANEMVFLFLGGFILALSMQRWGLDERIALFTLRAVGDRPHHIIGGFMLATAVMSMWVSNTATVAVLIPVAIGIGRFVAPLGTGGSDGKGEGVGFTLALLLGLAYSASIGGMATLIGSPPNLFVASFIRDRYGIDLGFVEWMLIGLPLVAVFLPLGWLLLTRMLYPVGREPVPGIASLVRERYAALGPPKRGEKATMAVFSLAVLAWITRPLLNTLEIRGATPFEGLTDPGIALGAALLLFVMPVDVPQRVFVMDWKTARNLPWGILVLFGGGLSLASALDRNGVSDFFGGQAGLLAGLPVLVVVAAVTLAVVMLTEMTSNTATTAVLAPVLAGVAPALGIDPYLLLVPLALAASAAFMLPAATPPNAMVFASDYMTIPQMARAGVWMNLVGVVLITLTAILLVPVVLGGGG